jgi:predicted nucleic acid-binding protein
MEHFYSGDNETKQRTSRKIAALVQRGEGILPTIVISEVVQTVCEQIGKDEAEICYANLTQSGLKIQSLSSPIAKMAGLLRSRHRNVPMGDCIIAATAVANQALILSDDPHFDLIKEAKRNWI